MSPRKKSTDEVYERPSSGPGSQARDPSVRQTISFGNAAWEQDDFAVAYQHFHAILKDHPDFADIRNRAGLCLAMMGDPAGVLEEFDAAPKVNDCDSEALLNRAIVLNDLGRFDEASECFHRASALDLRDSRAFPSHMGINSRTRTPEPVTSTWLRIGLRRPPQNMRRPWRSDPASWIYGSSSPRRTWTSKCWERPAITWRKS